MRINIHAVREALDEQDFPGAYFSLGAPFWENQNTTLGQRMEIVFLTPTVTPPVIPPNKE